MQDKDSKLIFEKYKSILEQDMVMYPTPTPVPEKEVYTTTPRQIIQNRYGKENAENLIAANREYTQNPENKYSPTAISTSQKYAVPKYTDANLNQNVPVTFKPLKKENNLATAHPVIGGNKININTKPIFDTTGNVRGELQGKQKPAVVWQSDTGKHISDILGHEGTHTLQSPIGGLGKQGFNPNETDKFRKYIQSADELPAWMSTLKYWYYDQTGKTLPANMTDQDINNVKKYWETNKKNYNPDSTIRAYDAVIETLDTPEGRELFRRTVLDRNKQNTNSIA